MKKAISVLLAGTMMLSMIPFATLGVSAAEATHTDGIYKFEDGGGWEPIRKTVTDVKLMSDTKTDFIYSGDTYYFDMSDIKFNVSFSDGNSAVFECSGTRISTEELDVFNTNFIVYNCEVNTNTSEAVFTMRGKNQTKGVSVTVPINSLEVESIAVEKEPEKTEYVGEQYGEFIPDGLKVRFNYTNGKSKVVNYTTKSNILSLLKVSCNNDTGLFQNLYFLPKVGDNALFLTFGECSTSFNIKGKAVESIEIQKLPKKVEYIAGEIISGEYIMDEIEILVKFEDGTSYVLDGKNNTDFFSVLELDEDYCYTIAEGNNVLTIMYGGKTATLNLTGKVVESIEIQKLPDITDYIVGDRVHGSQLVKDMEIVVKFADGTSFVETIDDEEYEYNGLEILGLDEDEAYTISQGDNTVTVVFRGKSTAFNVEGHTLESIEITKNSDKTRAVTDSFASLYRYQKGMEVKAVFADGESQVYPLDDMYTVYFSKIKYDGDNVYENSMLAVKKGENVVTLNLNGFTDEFIVTGYDVEKIEIAKMPDYMTQPAGYQYLGSTLFKGLEIKVTYDDGFSEIHDREKNVFLFEDLIPYGDNIEFFEWMDECLEYAVFTLKEGENVFTLEYYGCTVDIVITGSGETETGWGDVNRDEVVDVSDVTTLQMHLAGYDVDISREISDINYDGKTDVTDVTTLQMMLAGYDV